MKSRSIRASKIYFLLRQLDLTIKIASFGVTGRFEHLSVHDDDVYCFVHTWLHRMQADSSHLYTTPWRTCVYVAMHVPLVLITSSVYVAYVLGRNGHSNAHPFERLITAWQFLPAPMPCSTMLPTH